MLNPEAEEREYQEYMAHYHQDEKDECDKRHQDDEKKLNACKEAYEALCVIFPDDITRAMEFAINQHNTFATRSFVAWKLLREVFGPGKDKK